MVSDTLDENGGRWKDVETVSWIRRSKRFPTSSPFSGEALFFDLRLEGLVVGCLTNDRTMLSSSLDSFTMTKIFPPHYIVEIEKKKTLSPKVVSTVRRRGAVRAGGNGGEKRGNEETMGARMEHTRRHQQQATCIISTKLHACFFVDINQTAT